MRPNPRMLTPNTQIHTYLRYVRVKRKTHTFFLSCEPTEKVKTVKEEVGRIVGMEPRDIKFVGPDKVR